jgi:hypothetical protein
MTTQFRWFDRLHALSTCLACATASSSTDSLHNYAHNAPRESSTSSGSGSRAPHGQTNRQFLPEGLRPLLLEESTDDEYADTLSLRSNVGTTGRRRGEGTGREEAAVSARKKPPTSKSKWRGKEGRRDDGWFTILGYDLFGKRKGAIQLPLTDDEDEEDTDRNARQMSRTRSGSTLDSDAAPLDDAAIAAISQAHIDDQDYDGGRDKHDTAEEDVATIRERAKQAAKGERRQKRKERKALERALAAGSSLNSHEDGEFEGFQGSGAGVLVPRRKDPSHSALSRSTTPRGDDADEEEALADLGGSIYARITAGVPAAVGNNPESRTTTSTNISSNSSSESRHHRSHEKFHEDMTKNTALQPSVNSVNDSTKKKKVQAHRIKPMHPLSSSSVAASDSTQSASLPSPTGSISLGPGLSLSLSPSHPQSGSQTRLSQHPNPTRKDEKTKNSTPSFHNGFAAGGLVYDGENRSFPSVGFGRLGRGNGDSLSNGAFLARRGDE